MSPEQQQKTFRVTLFAVILLSLVFVLVPLHNIDIVHNMEKITNDLNQDAFKSAPLNIDNYVDCNAIKCEEYNTIYKNSMTMLVFGFFMMFAMMLYAGFYVGRF